MKGRSHRGDQPDDWIDGAWTVDCICGVNYDDGEEMVNCDECGVWVHTICSRYVKGDDLFACDKCKNKKNRDDSEETEVAQLLVELPTKTMRMETSFVPNGSSCRPFRLWTDFPLEDRVHVHGIPGGDPALFGGLSSIITAPELWKCSGYVPKKFNLCYREFPCWDDNDGGATEIEEENKNPVDTTKIEEEHENPVDKGAGVLFSLSKETVFANSITSFVGMYGKYEESCHSRKKYSRERKWGDDIGATPAKFVQNERRLLQSVALHSGKQKKEDLRTSKDGTRKKRARVSNKDSDIKEKVLHATKTVLFTPTSDARQLDFYEDIGPRFIGTETEKIKNGNIRDVSPRAHPSNGYPAVQNNCGKPKNNGTSMERPSSDPSADMSRHNSSTGADHEAGKVLHHATVRVESSSTRDGGASPLEPNCSVTVHRTEQEVNSIADNLEYGEEGSRLGVMKPVVDVATVPRDVKDSKLLENVTGVVSLCLVQANVEVKTESAYNNSRSVLKLDACSQDATHEGITSDHISENSEVVGSAVGSVQSISQKVQNVDINCVANGCHTNIVDDVSGGPCHPNKREEEVSRVPESNLIENKLSDIEPPKSSTPESCKALENQNPNHSNMQQVTPGFNFTITKGCIVDSLKEESRQDMGRKTGKHHPKSSDGHASSKKDRATGVVKDESRYNPERKSIKEQTKFSANSAFKMSHRTRISHYSATKPATSDSKDSGVPPSSIMLLVQNSAVTSGESSGLQNQSHSQLTAEVNHIPSSHPSLPSNSLAALSDEELALLLHQELNSSPRVLRLSRVRNAGSVPQLASLTGTSMHAKHTSCSGGKDHNLVSRRKNKDTPKEGFHSSYELKNGAKKMDRVSLSSPDEKRDKFGYRADVAKREDVRLSPVIHSFEKNPTLASIKMTNNGLSLLAKANNKQLLPIPSSPRNMSEDDTSTVGDRVHRTLPGLINEIMIKGQQMTYEELCNAVLPHWKNLRKHNGEPYAYASHSQAVLDCLRNRHEWAQLVDRGPKTNSGRKRRKYDAEPSSETEGIEYVNGEGKSFDSREEFPKGKRKVRKRRRLALQGRGVTVISKTRKADLLTDENVGPSSNSSEDSMVISEDEILGGGTHPMRSETSCSSDDKVNE